MGRTVHEEIIRLAAEDREAQAMWKRNEQSAQQLERGVVQAAKGIGLALTGTVVGGLKGVVGWLGKGVAAMGDFAALGALKVARGLDDMAESTRDANGELSSMGKAGKIAAGGLDVVAKAALTVSGIITGLHVATAVTVAGLIVSANRAANDFAPGWSRVSTVLQDTGANLGLLKVQVSRLAASVGADADTATAALYEILGAMPQLVEEPARALQFLREVLEVNGTGFATAGEAAGAVTGILNAFNMEVEQSTEVLNSLWAAQDAGKFVMGEVATQIGPLAATLSALGGDYKDMLAIIATTTQLGIPASQAVTQIESALGNLVKQSEQAKAAARELGVEFSAERIAVEGLNAVLLDIIEATGGNTSTLSKFFGDREGLQLMIQLGQRTDVLRQRMDDVNNSTGRHNEIVSEMNDNWVAQKRIMDQQVTGALRDLGMEYEGFGVTALKALNAVLAKWNELPDNNPAGSFGARLGDWIAENNTAGNFGARLTDRMFARPTPNPYAVLEQAGVVAPGSGPTLGTRTLSDLARQRAAAAEAARPRAEPTSIEYARQKLDDYSASLEVMARAAHARTGDFKAYEDQVRRNGEAVRVLAAAERDRLRAAGVGEASLNELALAAPAPRAPERQRSRASEERKDQRFSDLAADARREAEMLAAAGEGPLSSAPASVRGLMEDVLSVEREIRDTEREREEAAKRRNDVSGLDARLTNLRAERAEAEQLLRILGPLDAAHDRSQAQTEVAFAAGRIDEDAVELAGLAAGLVFNMGLARAIREAETSGELTQAVRVALGAAMKDGALPRDVIGATISAAQARALREHGTQVEEHLSGVRAALRLVEMAQQELNLAKAAGDVGGVAQAMRHLSAAERQVTVDVEAFASALRESGASEAMVTMLLANLENMLRSAGLSLPEVTTHLETFADRAGAVASLADAFAGLAENLGESGAEAVAFLRSIGQVGGALETASRAREAYNKKQTLGNSVAVASGYIGIATAIAGAVLPLFASEEDTEGDRIREQNNEELRRLQVELRGFRITGATTTDAVPAVAALAARESEITLYGASSKARQNALITETLAGFGMSMGELEALAESVDIDLFNDKGKLVAGALDQLAEALGGAARKMSRYSDTLDERRRYRDLATDLRNDKDVPAAEASGLLSDIQKMAPALFERFGLGGFDTSTEEGRKGLEAALLALVEAWRANGLTAEDLDGFTDIDELLGIIEGLGGAMDGLRESVQSVTESFINMPQGRKLYDSDRAGYDATRAVQEWERGVPLNAALLDPQQMEYVATRVAQEWERGVASLLDTVHRMSAEYAMSAAPLPDPLTGARPARKSATAARAGAPGAETRTDPVPARAAQDGARIGRVGAAGDEVEAAPGDAGSPQTVGLDTPAYREPERIVNVSANVDLGGVHVNTQATNVSREVEAVLRTRLREAAVKLERTGSDEALGGIVAALRRIAG